MWFAKSLNALNQVVDFSGGKRFGFGDVLAVKAGLPEIQVKCPREVKVAQIGLENAQEFKAIQGLAK